MRGQINAYHKDVESYHPYKLMTIEAPLEESTVGFASKVLSLNKMQNCYYYLGHGFRRRENK